jgi:hypothetical protein
MSDRELLAAVRAAGGQNPASPGGLHPGTEAVFLGAMPLLGLVGLFHRRLGSVSPFRPRGQHTPKGTRTRLAPTSASTRLPADYRDRTTKVSNAPPRLPQRPHGHWYTPGEYTIPWAQNLDTASRPVLFFGGPRRRDAPKHPPREARRAGGCSERRSWRSANHCAGRGGANTVSISIAQFHVVSYRG